MDDAVDRAARSARELTRRIGIEHHDVLLVLGTGLSGTAELLGAGEDSLPLDTLPFFPAFAVGGHRAQGWSVPLEGRRVLIYGGRCHLYEGYAAEELVHPVRTGIAAGCSTVILTSAAGGIRPGLRTGSVMVVEDHLNLTGSSPLHGPSFTEMTAAYAPHLRAAALAAPAPHAGAVDAQPGVYAQLTGPQFETPAEIRMLRTLGADVVGMSMAIETIAARHDGADVLGLALVANPAASDETPVDVDDVWSVGASTAPAVAAIVRHVVGSLP
jgi:purine-nucleoside phosphorylase